MSRPPIYLDHNATTPLDASVRQAVADALAVWGNPSSTHAVGRDARAKVERARLQVADLIGCDRDAVVFVSGGTEGNNLAIRGLARAAARDRGIERPHVVTSEIEHPSVLGAVEELQAAGFEVSRVPVDGEGRISVEALQSVLKAETVLVSLARANHELGNLYDVAALAEAAHEAGALVHSDVVQAVGRVPVDVGALGVDAATLSAHKLYGPRGVGAIYVRPGLSVDPLIAGGHQEHERRPGTENLPAIVGFGVAAEIALDRVDADGQHAADLRDRLQEALLQISGSRLNGADPRVPGTCNVGFDGARGDRVVIGLDLEGVCVSAGAACTSGSLEPSPVMQALVRAQGGPEAQAREAVRFSVGRETQSADVDRAAEMTALVVERVRAAGG